MLHGLYPFGDYDRTGRPVTTPRWPMTPDGPTTSITWRSTFPG
jgi:hypothetical protein